MTLMYSQWRNTLFIPTTSNALEFKFVLVAKQSLHVDILGSTRMDPIATAHEEDLAYVGWPHSHKDR